MASILIRGYSISMPRLPKHGSSVRQIAYAQRLFGGKGISKKQIALDVGYGPLIANSVSTKIENRRGYHNAVAKLAEQSGNLTLKVMEELQARGFDDFSNKELISAVSAMSGAWARFGKGVRDMDPNRDAGKNKLACLVGASIDKIVHIFA